MSHARDQILDTIAAMLKAASPCATVARLTDRPAWEDCELPLYLLSYTTDRAEIVTHEHEGANALVQRSLQVEITAVVADTGLGFAVPLSAAAGVIESTLGADPTLRGLAHDYCWLTATDAPLPEQTSERRLASQRHTYAVTYRYRASDPCNPYRRT